MRDCAQRIRSFGPSVFSEFSALAAKHGAVNLGQGFPDFDGPEEIKALAAQAVRDGPNQYAPSVGSPKLRRAIADHAARFYGDRVDPETMVTVTSGATEGLFAAAMALIDPGDEVVLFEPFYDSYFANVLMAGGVPRCVALQPPDGAHGDWWFDRQALRELFGSKTRLLILNTPHNPTGKVFTRPELDWIAELCEAHDVRVLTDEVYEHLVFAPAKHLRFSSLPGMRERTVTVSSAGKSFSLTGWKVGWIIAPPPLRDALQSVHQFITFATVSPLQEAVAAALALPDAYFRRLALEFKARRDLLVAGLCGAGMPTVAPAGGYFAMADIRAFGFEDDFAFCRALTERVGVAAIPPSALYFRPRDAAAQGMARFAFCKSEAVLRQGLERLHEVARLRV